jgi:hypothetical protein
MNRRIGTTTLVSASLLAIMMSGSVQADSKVRVIKGDVDLQLCRTFAWQAQSEDPASILDQRVRAAIMSTLQTKGYKEVTANPDCRVAYVFASQEASRKSGPSIGVGVGGGSGGIGGGIGIGLPIGRKKQTGTITIDVIDPARNAQIWSGSLDGALKSAELTEAEAKKWVSKVLAEYPDAAAQPRK